MRRTLPTAVLLLLAAAGSVAVAGKAPQPAPAASAASAARTPRKVPKTHSLVRKGVPHAVGGENARQKCVICHGPDLRGGKMAKVSCFECHQQKWK